MGPNDELLRRAEAFTRRYGLTVGNRLGAGVHGIVFATESQPENGAPEAVSAIKVHRHEPDYRRERDVYQRLKELGITSVRGFHVPQLLRHDDQLLVLELSIVTRPFVLDFAGAFLDRAPDFSEEVLADWRAEKKEQFGSRWAEVQAILRALEGMGVYMVDVNPGNIAFAE
jgi:hypothetical protein